MKKLFVLGILGIWLLLSSIAQAGEGTAGSDFINLMPGARSAALAGCYTAAGNDAEAVFANPAGIIGLLNPQIGLSHLSWWEGVLYDAVWGVQPLGKLGSVGVAAALLNVLPFNSTEEPEAGTEQAWSLLVSGTYAMRIQKSFAIGGQLKYFMSSLGPDQSWGMAVDLGAQYFMQNDQFILATTFKNIGAQAAFLEKSDAMPMTMDISAAYRFWPDDPYRLLLTGTVALPVYSRLSMGFGAEGWLENIVALRFGVKVPQDTGDWLTIGTGIRWRRLHVDYALSPLGVLGMVHRVSLGYDFGSQKRLERPKLSVSLVTKQFVLPSGEAGYAIHFIPKAHVAAGVTKWELLIQNARDQKIRKFQGEKIVPMSVVWDGLDALGTRVDTESTYYYQVRVWDRQGYSVCVGGEILPISITSLPKLKAVPRDIFAGKLFLQPKDVKDMQEWSVDIMSDDHRLLKRYSGSGGIPKDFAWDGKDMQNNMVAVKKGYHFILRVKDKANNEMKSIAPIIVVDAGTKAWTESGLALDEQVPFHFEPTDIKIKCWGFDIIETESGEVVRSYAGSAPLPENLIWDSRDNNGKKVSTKKQYSYVLRLQDQIGNVWRQAATIAKTEVKVLPADEAELKIKVEQILFDFNQAELKPGMFRKIKKVADLARAADAGKTKIYIAGHTDEIGTDKHNFELSLQRANMVMRYLVEEEGLSSANMRMKGYGKTRPLIQGETAKSQAQNRRVEITLVFE